MRARTWVASVRARVTLGAVLAVGVALAVVAVLVVRMTAGAMISDAQNAAEVQARNLAIVADAGRIGSTLDVDAAGTTILQVVTESGEILGASPQLRGVPALGDSVPAIGAGTASTVRVESWRGQATDYRVVAVGSESPSGPVAVYAGVSLAESERVLSGLTRTLWVALGSVLVVVAGISWLVTGWALRPVDSMRREVDKFTDQDLDRRVPVPAHQDEIRRLALTMNRMLDRLQESADRQRAFIADASHELRSPLASLRTQLEVAAAHPGSFRVAELAEETLVDALRLEDLTAGLLELAKLDAGVTRPQVPINVGRELARLVRERHADRVSTTVDAPEGLVASAPDSVFSQVLSNLLDNAVRHAETEVVVTAKEVGGMVEVSVRDDGPGVPREDTERIFQRFVRLDSARSRESGGTGLGLPIARELARSAGGDVEALESSSGGAFRLTLPVQR